MPTPNKPALIELLDGFAEAPRHRRGALGFRVIVGLTLLGQLGLLLGQFELIFGAEAIVEFRDFAADFGVTHYSYFALSPSLAWQRIGYGLALAIVAAWLTGAGARRFGPALTLLTWWAVHSVHSRCPTLWDGGDNLIEIILIYAIPIDLWQRAALGRSRTVLHNLGVAACALQVCMLYLTAGLAKIPGEYWQNGTAFYYVLASREFGLTGLGPTIWGSRTLLALMTWAPVLLQLGFAWIYLFGRAWPRRLIVALAIGFHLGILTLMGLGSFALFMIGVELLLLSDADWAAFSRLGARLRIGGARA